jgi:hypothetical protein
MKKIISTTRSNFADLRTEGLLYIDKTQQIYDCLLGVDKYFFLARPRRFGKSLLCTTLQELFLGNRDLFKELWIDQSDWKWEKHPVVRLDMTLVAGSSNTAEKIEAALLRMLQKTARDHEIALPIVESSAAAFEVLLTMLSEKTGKGVVVIIDEYDKPILDLVDEPEIRKKIHAILRDFYAPLKPLESMLRFVFITGVYKFTQTSIFSNLNNLNDLTFSQKAGALIGYTEKEMRHYFDEEIDQLAKIFNIGSVDMLERLRVEYNGYRFGVNVNTGQLSESVYNSFAMNHVFAKLELVRKWFASGSPSFLIKKIQAGSFQAIEPQGMHVPFGNLENSCSPDAITATSLFYYAGYATMQEFEPNRRMVRLGYPNLEVSQETATQLMALFMSGSPSLLYELTFKIADALRNHQFDELKELLNQALAQITYQVLAQVEAFFQLAIMLILQMGRLPAEAEIPTNDGRMDIVCELSDQIIIVEVKFNEPAKVGLKQIIDKDYAKKFRALGRPMIAVGVSIALGKDSLGRDVENKSCVVDVASQVL